MIKLGRLHLKNPFVLAPMAMYSDFCFRKICSDYGSSYSFTELMHTAGFIRKPETIRKKFDFYEPIGLQFISNKPEELKEAIRIVREREFYPTLENVKSIDLNLGCPAPDEMNENLGAALLNQPKKVRELFQVMAKHSELPVSAKIRLAINIKHKKTKPYLRIAKIAEEEGLDFITIHARTARQQYSGEIDLGAIKVVSEQVDIPLIGNGNVVDEKSADAMLEYCDAVMIGRKALKDPFIFRQLNYHLEHDKKQKQAVDLEKEKTACVKKYLSLAEKHNAGFQQVKIHMQSFLRGTPGGKKTIVKLTHTKSMDDVERLMRPIID